MAKKRETSYSVKLFQITTNSKKIFSAILGLELLFAIYSLYSPHFSTAPRGRRLKIRYSIFGLTYKTICFFFFSVSKKAKAKLCRHLCICLKVSLLVFDSLYFSHVHSIRRIHAESQNARVHFLHLFLSFLLIHCFLRILLRWTR